MFLEENFKRRMLELGGILQENIQAAKTYLEKKGITKDSPEWQDFEEIRDVIFPKNPNYVYKFVKFRMEKDPIHGTPPSMEMIRQTAKSLLAQKNILSRLPQPVEKYDSIERLNDDLYLIQSQQQVNKLYKDFSKKMQSAISQMSEQQKIDYDNLLKQIVNIVDIASYQKKHSQISNPDELLTNTQLYLESLQGYQQTLSNLESHPDKVRVLYAKDGVILAEFLTINYDEVKPLACNTNWCIIRDKGNWNTYIMKGLNNFFVLWNFNYGFQDKESMIGFHVDLSNKIIHAHGRSDENFKNEIETTLSTLNLRGLVKPRKIEDIDLDNLSGSDIALVLRFQPQLHPLFDLSKLDGNNIAEVLRRQPQLHPLFDLSQLSGWYIALVLVFQPQLHPHFDLSKLSGDEIEHVLKYQPKLKDVLKKDLQEIRRMVRKIILENYKGEHESPDKESGSPIFDLTGIYPEDIYSNDANRLYGSFESGVSDAFSLSIIRRVRNKPNSRITIYRAVPDLNKEVNRQINDLKDILIYYYRFNFFPIKNKIIHSLEEKYKMEEDYDEKQKLILQDIKDQIVSLSSQKEKQLKINPGDWVTINKQYAVSHGRDNLGGNYKILSKTVRAKELYTDGNSIHEWGYSPE